MLTHSLQNGLALRHASVSGMTARIVRLGLVVGVAMLGVARPASADCTETVRPATAEEKKAYADGFALFL